MARKEVVARAETEADRIISEGDERARAMRAEAEDYVDAKLAQFENSIRRIVEASQSSTKSLNRTLDRGRARSREAARPGDRG